MVPGDMEDIKMLFQYLDKIAKFYSRVYNYSVQMSLYESSASSIF